MRYWTIEQKINGKWEEVSQDYRTHVTMDEGEHLCKKWVKEGIMDTKSLQTAIINPLRAVKRSTDEFLCFADFERLGFNPPQKYGRLYGQNWVEPLRLSAKKDAEQFVFSFGTSTDNKWSDWLPGAFFARCDQHDIPSIIQGDAWYVYLEAIETESKKLFNNEE